MLSVSAETANSPLARLLARSAGGSAAAGYSSPRAALGTARGSPGRMSSPGIAAQRSRLESGLNHVCLLPPLRYWLFTPELQWQSRGK
jgi:hypothetical protein